MSIKWVKNLSLGLLLSISFQGMIPRAIAQETGDRFDDIATHWSRHVINWLAGNNPTQTVYLNTPGQKFRPGCRITRGEWVLMFMDILDLKNRPDVERNRLANAPNCRDIPGWKCPFSDIPATQTANPPALNPYYQPSFQAFRTGMISGYSDGTFRPNQKMVYPEAVASLAGVLNLIPQIEKLKKEHGEDPAIQGTDYFMNGIAFQDAWFAPALHGALLANLVAIDWPLEFPSYLPPLSRGEAAMIMYLVLVYRGEASLDNPMLKEEISPGSGHYAFRHIRMAGQPNFSFAPPGFYPQCEE